MPVRRWKGHLSPSCPCGDDSGAALVMTAVFLVILLGFSALVVDVALLYVNRLVLVNAVDAAALAGVQNLPYSPTMAMEIAKQYASRNGAPRDGVSVTVANGDCEIRVSAYRDVDLYFARIFGLGEQRLHASATAQVGTIAAYMGVVPFGVVEQDFVYGEQYILKHGPQTVPGHFRGNFGALALGARGAANYEEKIKYGYQERLAVGDWVETEPGNIAGPTAEGVKFRLDQCQHYPKCTWDNYVPGCSRIVIVPVIRGLEKANGRDNVEVVGFAAFFLEGTLREGAKGNSGSSSVIGRFLRIVVPGELGEAGDYGLRGYKLVG
ncbi:MAG: hypothetical protein GX855_11245 [Firmicutes bacterium]|nr:hypothetical protein [Bacillota bacterium]